MINVETVRTNYASQKEWRGIMRNKRLIIALLAAILFGLIAAFSVKQYLLNAQAYSRNLNDVVVAKVEIPVGSRIIPEQLTIATDHRRTAP